MLNYKKAQTASQEQFKSLTSLTKEEFEELLKTFTEVWEEQDNHRGSPEKLASCGDKLFFILFYLKNYPIQEVLGFLFGLDQSQANRWIQVLSQILKRTLERGGYLPARAGEQLEERFTKGQPHQTCAELVEACDYRWGGKVGAPSARGRRTERKIQRQKKRAHGKKSGIGIL